MFNAKGGRVHGGECTVVKGGFLRYRLLVEVQTTEEPTHYLYSLSGLAKCTRCLQIGGQLGFETQFHSEAEEEQFFLTPFLTLFLKIEGATS